MVKIFIIVCLLAVLSRSVYQGAGLISTAKRLANTALKKSRSGCELLTTHTVSDLRFQNDVCLSILTIVCSEYTCCKGTYD